MPELHHVSAGEGADPVVLIHGFGCDHTDWQPQIAHLSPSRRVIAVDLPGHGASPAGQEACSIERYGAAVAELTRALGLSGATVIGHSLGCRVAVEVALQAPERVKSVVLVDGSQFAPAMGATLREVFSHPDGFATLTQGMFRDMFSPHVEPATASRVIARAVAMSRAVGEKMLLDLHRYDVTRWTSSLACLRVPVQAIQATYANEKRERQSMHRGQSSPYLDMLRQAVPGVDVEIIEDSGHFPQLEQPALTNAALDRFLASVG